jgi:hypothetical protein
MRIGFGQMGGMREKERAAEKKFVGSERIRPAFLIKLVLDEAS